MEFNQTRGYGFIAPDGGGDDVFLHSEELKAYADQVRVGTRVQFDVVDGQRGLKAFDVTVLDLPSQPPRPVLPRLGGPPVTDDDELSEVIPAGDYAREITDALIAYCPDVTAAQIVAIRDRLTVSARKRGWLED